LRGFQKSLPMMNGKRVAVDLVNVCTIWLAALEEGQQSKKSKTDEVCS